VPIIVGVHPLLDHPRARLIVLAPLKRLLHVVILTPLRLVALVTLLDTRWGTREVESK